MKNDQVAWFLYILRCADGSLYTGITTDLERRLQKHQKGRASKYTRSRLPVKLVYQERCQGRANALIREFAVKALAKAKKEVLAGQCKSMGEDQT